MELTPDERAVFDVLSNVHPAYTHAQEARTGAELRGVAELTCGKYLQDKDLNNVNWDAMLQRIQNP